MNSRTIFSNGATALRKTAIASVCLLCVGASAQGQAGKSKTPASQQAAGSSQPLKLTPEQMKELLRSAQTGEVKASPRVANPRAGRSARDSSIIAVLHQQKQTADTERATLLSSRMTLASAHGSGAPQQPMGTLTASGNPPPCPPGRTATNAAGQTVNAAGQPCTPGANNPLPAPCPPGVTSTAVSPCGPEPRPTPTPSKVNMVPAPVSTTVTPSRPVGPTMMAMPCAMQKTTIATVSGKTKGTVFSPPTADNGYISYSIRGCNFGDTQGQAHLNGPFAHGQVQLQIELWTDTQILAKVDPTISGEQDQDNVSLVVAPASGPQVQATGFSFYAAREEVQLTKIPKSAVTFASISDIKWRDILPQYSSPAVLFPGATSGTYRYDLDSWFGGGQDYYDFSGLAPNFTTSNQDLKHTEWTAGNCYSGGTLYRDTNFSAVWDGDNIRVTFGYFHCHAPDILLVKGEEIAASNYGLSVWVVGPRGIDPWSK
jgi:hypothetical protein